MLTRRERNLKRRGCDGKQPFVTRALALDVLRRMKRGRDRGGRLHLYACEFGDHWHLGNRSGNTNARRESAAHADQRRAARSGDYSA